jgi:hypothetical protein
VLESSRTPRPGIPIPYKEIYQDGEYVQKPPTWHVEESPFKTRHILQFLHQSKISPRTICEVGCGAGEVLRQLQLQMSRECEFWGYEISPQAYTFSLSRANERTPF